ncbi:YihY/virulence factor BrkB family protein [Conexibacter woesei]|uniref:Ribonuclease BN n=1 Tax=Conexibacter woesei (strain DSM 14684 / CCUG 47730 / CIP 108061 / JCM 11494 / NBRC 100937 / ID131577) TaxID=469383 RepID=D3FAZ7_CONWI|nr:YihY/virulence factor BrkB family protein [Conexibacter woesei]ADB53189.1 ribonuclease BN [Conexibacter woesei DSM 14684]
MARTGRRSGGLIGRLRGDPPRGERTAPPPAAEPAPEPPPEGPAPAPAAPTPAPERAAAEPPEGPTDIEPRGWLATLKRAAKGFREDGLQDWAAALTYYSVLSLFPLLIVFVALIGVFGEYPRTVNSMLDIVRQIAPGSTADTLESSLSGVVRNKGGAGALLGIGLLTALWSASGYIGAFMRAANAVYDVEEGRPFWKLRPLQLAVTAVMVVLIALLAIGFVLSGSVAKSLGDTIGLGDSAVTVWNIAKWPVMLLIAVVMIALLTYVGPNVKHPRFRWITPGAAVGIGILILASLGFAFYAANLGSYNATYGALGGVIVFLIWLWIANLALLFGVELDVELERQRELESGQPEAARELQLEPRDAPEQ